MFCLFGVYLFDCKHWIRKNEKWRERKSSVTVLQSIFRDDQSVAFDLFSVSFFAFSRRNLCLTAIIFRFMYFRKIPILITFYFFCTFSYAKELICLRTFQAHHQLHRERNSQHLCFVVYNFFRQKSKQKFDYVSHTFWYKFPPFVRMYDVWFFKCICVYYSNRTECWRLPNYSIVQQIFTR